MFRQSLQLPAYTYYKNTKRSTWLRMPQIGGWSSQSAFSCTGKRVLFCMADGKDEIFAPAREGVPVEQTRTVLSPALRWKFETFYRGIWTLENGNCFGSIPEGALNLIVYCWNCSGRYTALKMRKRLKDNRIYMILSQCLPTRVLPYTIVVPSFSLHLTLLSLRKFCLHYSPSLHVPSIQMIFSTNSTPSFGTFGSPDKQARHLPVNDCHVQRLENSIKILYSLTAFPT